jgi:hypothetical protein
MSGEEQYPATDPRLAQDVEDLRRVVEGGGLTPSRRPPSETESYGWKPPSKLSPEEQAASTARTLAFLLVATLVLSYVVQNGLVVLMSFYNKPEAVATLEHIFNQWLPVLSGLVGTAVGFYLKERK